MKPKPSKALIAFREGRLTVDEFRRYVELKNTFDNDPNYKVFQNLTDKILRK